MSGRVQPYMRSVDGEVRTEDRVVMACFLAQEHFVLIGLAVQLEVHAPHEADAESEWANRHAHLLITKRQAERVTPKGP